MDIDEIRIYFVTGNPGTPEGTLQMAKEFILIMQCVSTIYIYIYGVNVPHMKGIICYLVNIYKPSLKALFNCHSSGSSL